MKKYYLFILFFLLVYSSLGFCQSQKVTGLKQLEKKIQKYIDQKKAKKRIEQQVGLERAEREIENYYKEVKEELNTVISIIEIEKSEKDSNFLFVYFLENMYIDYEKDIYGNINSSETPIMVAVYSYSYLTHSWRLKTIREAEEGLIFKIDEEHEKKTFK